MPFSTRRSRPGSLRASETWRLRARTGEALVRLLGARLLIELVPLRLWRDRLGKPAPADRQSPSAPTPDQRDEAQRLAIHVERAAGRLPIGMKCLPRALALAGMLRARGLPYELVIAARPASVRDGVDDLHAWIDVGDRRVVGDVAGPWMTVLATRG